MDGHDFMVFEGFEIPKGGTNWMKSWAKVLVVYFFLLSSIIVSQKVLVAQTVIEPKSQKAYQEAREHFQKKDFERAYRILWGAVKEDPENIDLNFYLGRAAFELQRYEAAAAAFERILIINKDLHRVRLELARAYYNLNAFVLAREEFEKVLKTNPPEAVKKNIQQFLDAISKLVTPHRISTRLALGYQFDSNVNVGPSNEEIQTNIGTFTITEASTPQSDFAKLVSLNFSHTFDVGQEAGEIWSNNLSYFRSFHNKFNEYDLGALNLSLGPGYIGEKYKFQFPVSYDSIQLGYDPYATFIGFNPSFSYVPKPSLDLTLSGTLQDRHYDRTDDAGRNGSYFSLEFTPRAFINMGGQMIQGSIKYARETTKASSEANEGWEYSAGFLTKLPWDLTAYLQYAYREPKYEGAQALFDDTREDKEHRFITNLSKNLPWDLSGVISFAYTRNDSNLALYDYTRRQVTFMLSKGF
ncbi:MAG: surface lipoprotein assembly modifier [Pseudomonadota bacterium]